MKKIAFFLFSFFIVSAASAQKLAKKALSTDDFASWEIIPNSQISNDGNYVLYEQNPLKGDGKLLLKHAGDTHTFPRGYKAKIGSESDFIAFNIKQPEDSVRKAKREKVKKDKMPKDSLGIFIFKNRQLITYPNIKSFKLPEENAQWLAFTVEPGKEKKDTLQKAKKVKQAGDDLVLFNVEKKDTFMLKHVTEYEWAKKGRALIAVRQTKDSAATFSALVKFNAENGRFTTLLKTEGWIKKAVIDEMGNQSVFLLSKDTVEEKKVYALYYTDGEAKPQMIVDESTKGMPLGWSPSENGKLWFSKDGSKIYLGTAETPVVEPKDTLLDEDKPKVDVWNWRDAKLQPQQLLEAAKEEKRTYLAVYNFPEKSFVQLADLTISTVSTIQKGNGKIGLGYDDSPYMRSSSWTGEQNRDYYVVDFETGIKRQILTKKSYVQLSPEGKYIVWYEPEDSSFYSMSTSINNLDTVSLTRVIPVSFYNEWHDTPSDPRPYGIAGWSKDDRIVYIYDRYDIWKLDPKGEKVPVNMTKTFGRRNNTRLRYVKLDPELDYIPEDTKILLSAIDERTMSRGYFETQLNTIKDPSLLIMDKYAFGGTRKAKEADKIIWTKQDVKTFPDVWSSTLEFEQVVQISSANQQQDEFVWADVELVEWTSFNGEKLKGLLYKPENLKPDHKYPMIVYFYERSSETMHYHAYPKPSHSTINKTFYASNGYLVFVPDITYKDGYPGQSAYNAIVSGTHYLINKYPFIDKEHLGLQGQSWGGYQTAWLITQTDLYAAAMAGAPVSNMTSAYGGIRWGSGRSRMFQYEHTQSRIGGTLWEKPLLYLENSPVFHAPKINTPLLMMHNDKDGAVPWYQGIEMFVALRRLNKPVWMLNYNGEPHNLPVKSWANRMDLSKRMFQFFNHYLKGEPAPEWMEKGVPAVEKGKNPGY